MSEMTHTERIKSILSGEKPDYVPVALWRHFPVDDQDPLALAESVLDFQRAYDFDFVKVTPASSFCLQDWGVRDTWKGNPEGTRAYVRRVIQSPKDWEKIKKLDPAKGSLGGQLKCLKRVCAVLGKQTPVVQTVFHPLAQAKNLAGGDVLMEHLRRWPDAVEAGLKRISAVTTSFIAASLEKGADGIFLALQHASYRLLDDAVYARFGTPFDRQLLKAAEGGWLNVLHLHGEAVMFDLAAELPVQIVNWHDRESGPPLKEGWKRSGKIVCGGWRQWETIALGDPKSVEKEAQDAIRQMDGRHLILGTGCVTPVISPRGNLAAASRKRKVK